MNPPSDDNYGCDYCSLLCLPTTPVTIVMATTKGVIYHCLVMVGKNEDKTVGFREFKRVIAFLISSMAFRVQLFIMKFKHFYAI